MSDLPNWFRIVVLSLLLVILIGVIVIDARSDNYEAQAIALALVGVIGASLGLERLRGGGDDSQ